MCLSHKFQDGISTSVCLKAWSSSAQGCLEKEKHFPSFEASKLFPSNEELPVESISDLGRAMATIGNSVTRRFLFDSLSIAKLKGEASKGSLSVKYPSGVEVVSAFIWKSLMIVSHKNSGFRKASIVSHAVDLRRRMIPPLRESSVRNLLWVPNIQCKIEDDIELRSLVSKLRGTFLEINSDFVKRLQEGEGLSVISENLKKMGELCSTGDVDYYGFTSWSKFGIYDIDFGWGKPIWVSSLKIDEQVFMNLVHMLETKIGGGIEAWITLEEREMEMLLDDDEFLVHTTLDPSPLLLGVQ